MALQQCRGDPDISGWSPKGRDGTESVPYRKAKLTLCCYSYFSWSQKLERRDDIEKTLDIFYQDGKRGQ